MLVVGSPLPFCVFAFLLGTRVHVFEPRGCAADFHVAPRKPPSTCPAPLNQLLSFATLPSTW
jgi:hypothetical protein